MALVLNTRENFEKHADKDGFVIWQEFGHSKLVYFFGDRAEVEIPEGVEFIGKHAFQWSRHVRKVRFPKTLKKIGTSAFWCSEIESAELPEGLTEIGATAFAYCPRLRTVHLPESLECLDYGAFEDCENLVDLKIPHHIFPEACAFTGCKGLADENGFVIVGNRLFGYFGNDKSVRVPEGVRTIDFLAFMGGRFESISLPESLRSIGGEAFCDCPNLKHIRIPEHIEEISPYAIMSSRARVEVPERILGQLGPACPRNWVGYEKTERKAES